VVRGPVLRGFLRSSAAFQHGINLALCPEPMRAQTLGWLSCGVLLFGGALAACGSPASDEPTSSGGAHSAGSGNAAGSNSAAGSAGSNSAAGSQSYAGQGGASNGGGGPSAGAGGVAQGGSGGVSGVGGVAGSSLGGTGGAAAGGTGGSSSSAGAGGGGGAPNVPAVKFVVYLDDYTGSWTSWSTKIDFSKMTHLNLAFMGANNKNDWYSIDGQSDSDIKAVVAKAHAAGVKVLASLGGGGGDSTVVNQYKNPSNDDALVNNLDAFLNRLNIDGADIDIEKESKADVGDNYGTFVSKVVAKLHPEGKLVTAAVAQYLQPYMNDDTLHLFDFVNIMVYSSKVSDYQGELDYFTGKSVPKEKLTLGVISESGNHTSTSATTSIVALSKSYGGTMLWDLAEDSTGQASVYKAIQGSL